LTLTKSIDQAGELITWLRSKTQVLGLMRDVQAAMNQANQIHDGRILSVIRAVLTRWTAHYLAYKRLLELKWVLETVTQQDALRLANEQILVSGDAKAKEKARKIIMIAEDADFWQSIAM
jgi:hypothetical protein